MFDPSLDGGTIELLTVDNEHSILKGKVMGITHAPSGPIFYLVGYEYRDYGRSALYAYKNVNIDASALTNGITIARGGDDAWMALFDSGPLTENSDINPSTWSVSAFVSPLTADQNAITRPQNGLGDVGAIEFKAEETLRINIDGFLATG